MFVEILLTIGAAFLGILAAPDHELFVDKDDVTFIALGDWGDRVLPGQEDVAVAMNSWAGSYHPDFVATTGDNFYQNGITSPDDTQVDTQWRDVYLTPGKPNINQLAWYVSLGNHDYGEFSRNEWNQVNLSYIEPQWVLSPRNYDSMRINVANSGAPFVVDIWLVDSQSIRADENDWQGMLDWLDAEMAASTAEWKLVVGHHPAYSAGDHGMTTSAVINYILPIMENRGAQMYICGHDHNLQHLVDHDYPYLDYIVSGAGGAALYQIEPEKVMNLTTWYNVEMVYGSVSWGFAGFRVSADVLDVQFVRRDNVVLYDYSRGR